MSNITAIDPNPFQFSPMRPEKLDPFIAQLPLLLGGLWMLDRAVAQANRRKVVQLQEWGVHDGYSFLKYADRMLRWVPFETYSSREIYNAVCVFYFILDQPVIRHAQTPIDPNSVDVPLSPVSQWIVTFANKVGSWHDTEASLTEESLQTFRNATAYNFDKEALVPEGGFKTFNQLFARRLKPGMRPIDSPDDDSVIVFPADSTFDDQWPVDNKSVVPIMADIKTLEWPIAALLESSAYSDAFAGGTWMHSFLNTFDYHRQHAPVSGRVLEAKVIQGQAYIDVQLKSLGNGTNRVVPRRTWSSNNGTYAFNAIDGDGYQFLQTRGCIIIDNPVLGLVAVLPIGMSTVSSVTLTVQDITRKGGDGVPSTVKKGDEISFFQFGGSDIVLVFQNPAIKITAKQQHYLVGQELARLMK